MGCPGSDVAVLAPLHPRGCCAASPSRRAGKAGLFGSSLKPLPQNAPSPPNIRLSRCAVQRASRCNRRHGDLRIGTPCPWQDPGSAPHHCMLRRVRDDGWWCCRKVSLRRGAPSLPSPLRGGVGGGGALAQTSRSWPLPHLWQAKPRLPPPQGRPKDLFTLSPLPLRLGWGALVETSCLGWLGLTRAVSAAPPPRLAEVERSASSSLKPLPQTPSPPSPVIPCAVQRSRCTADTGSCVSDAVPVARSRLCAAIRMRASGMTVVPAAATRCPLSPPPCGEGAGVGVLLRNVPLVATPPARFAAPPSPSRGGLERSASSSLKPLPQTPSPPSPVIPCAVQRSRCTADTGSCVSDAVPVARSRLCAAPLHAAARPG